jgi:hypothetical protein
MRFADAVDLDWDGDNWTGRVRLASWQGFQSRCGSYGSLSSSEPSDGSVGLVLGPEGRGTEAPTEQEATALRWLLNNEAKVQRSILKYLLAAYPSLQAEYEYPEDEATRVMPLVSDEQGFRSLIGLHSVYLHPLSRAGLPYIGFEFGCTWDDEHGLGFLLHGDRVVRSGGAETSFLLWMAREDAEAA